MMETSPEIGALAEALSKAQAEIKGALKDSSNPFFSSRYADLESVWEACRVALTNHGLAVMQAPSREDNAIHVATMLVHASGQWARSSLSAIPKDMSPQAVGSVTTYLRRYGLAAMVGVAPADDDGNAAQGTPNTPATRAERRDAAKDQTRRDNADSGPYAHPKIDTETGEVTPAERDAAWVPESHAVLMARRAALPEALHALIPTDEDMHAIPPVEATENLPFMIGAIVRKAKERKISPKEWGSIMERFFGSSKARLLNNQGTPVSTLNPYFVAALYREMDVDR